MEKGPHLSSDPRAVRQRVEAIRKLLEGLISTAEPNHKTGRDVILDLVPVAGKAAAAALGNDMAW